MPLFRAETGVGLFGGASRGAVPPRRPAVARPGGSGSQLRAGVGGRSVRVDPRAEVIHGFTLAEEGEFKTPGRGAFDKDAIRAIVRLAGAAEHPKGLKCRFTHPTPLDDGLGTYLGRLVDPYLDTSGPRWKARGDLRVSPSSHDTPFGDLGGYVLKLAEEDPDALSSSLVVAAEQEHRPGGPPLWRPKALFASDVVDQGDAVGGLLGGDRSAGRTADPAAKPAPVLTGTLAFFGRRPTGFVVLDPATPKGLSRAVVPVLLRGSVDPAAAARVPVFFGGRQVAAGFSGSGLTFRVDGDTLAFALPARGSQLAGVAELVRLHPGRYSAALDFDPILADVRDDELRVRVARVRGVDVTDAATLWGEPVRVAG